MDTEEALAVIACERIRARERPRILIGGLGMGFTLRAALAALGADARIVVAELVPAVLVWARTSMVEVFGNSLTDPRVSVREADVGHLIRTGRSHFDAILLDVDNGPQGLTRKPNDRLYDLEGLSAARSMLRRGGVLAVWSSGPNPNFVQRLRKTGFIVNEVGFAPTERVAVRATSSRSQLTAMVVVGRLNDRRPSLGKALAFDFGQIQQDRGRRAHPST